MSDECKDLLQSMLTTDPLSRLTIQGIMEHPWFLRDLPAGALEVNSRLKMMDNVRCVAIRQAVARFWLLQLPTLLRSDLYDVWMWVLAWILRQIRAEMQT